MEKQILRDYIDTCELIKETKLDIRRLKGKKKRIIQDKASPFIVHLFSLSQ